MIIPTLYNDYLRPRITLEPINSRTNLSSESYTNCYNSVENWLQSLELNVDFEFIQGARFGIELFSKQVELGETDQSFKVETTSGSAYLSSCVTNTLNKIPKSLGIGFALDFGNYEDIDFSKYKWVDDAWSLQPELIDEVVNKCHIPYITSLPKIMGLPIGGLIFFNKHHVANVKDFNKYRLEHSVHSQFSSNLEDFFLNFNRYRDLRVQNVKIIYEKLSNFGFQPFFNKHKTSFPGAAIVKYDEVFDEIKAKKNLWSLGVRGTSFFGNNALILPCHQNLNHQDLEYICESAKLAVLN